MEFTFIELDEELYYQEGLIHILVAEAEESCSRIIPLVKFLWSQLVKKEDICDTLLRYGSISSFEDETLLRRGVCRVPRLSICSGVPM